MTTAPLPRAVRAGALAGTLALAGCASGTPASSPTTSAATAPSTTGDATTTTMPAPTVQDVLTKLQAAGATDPVINTAEDDTNHLLGRPGGYTARAAFALPGGNSTVARDSTDRGGSIEIWPDAASAKARSEHIKATLAASPILGTEYHYLAGPVLVRVTGNVTPANAKKVEDVVKTLPQ